MWIQVSDYATRELACAAGADYKWEGVSRHFSTDALAIVWPGEFGKLDLYHIQLGLSGLAYGASRNRTGVSICKYRHPAKLCASIRLR
jgi:hypothetical protein